MSINSGLVINEQTIREEELLTKTITVSRINHINLGTRIWYEVLSTDSEFFSRWSFLMDPTDETLFLASPGDVLEITYFVNDVQDPDYNTFVPFTRQLITSAKFGITSS